MVKVKLIDGKWEVLEKGSKDPESMYMDGIFKTNLDNAKRIIKHDWDFLWVFDGMEGAGKSVLGIQTAYYLTDGKFTLDQITYSPKEFKEQILKCPKHGCVIFDEAFRGMSARAAMTQTNRMLMGMLQEIRQKNLFVIIILPSIWDLDKYVAIHRTAGLFHIHVGNNRERGFYKYYNKSQITNLLKDYKLKYKYPYAPKFKGRFTKFNPFDEAYRKKKGESLNKFGYDEEQAKDKSSIHAKRTRILLKKLIKEKAVKEKKTEKRICDEIGVNYGTYRHWESEIAGMEGTNLENPPEFNNI